VPFGEENNVTTVSQAVKTLKGILKTLKRKVIWLSLVFLMARCSGRASEDWKTEVVIPITRRETGKSAITTNYGGIYLLNLPGKVYAWCLEKRRCGIIERNLDNTQCGFVLVVAIQVKFSLAANFRQTLNGGCQKCLHMFRWPRMHIASFLTKSLAEYGVDNRLLLATKSLYSCPAQKFVSVSAELSHNRSPWVLDSDKGVCCQHSFS